MYLKPRGFFAMCIVLSLGKFKKAHAHGDQDKLYFVLEGNIRIKNLTFDNLKIVIQSILDQDKKP